MNRTFLLGNVGAEPELRYTQSGTPVLNLRLATTDGYKDRDGAWQEVTEWHNITIWGKRGEALSKILDKGSRILVDGRLHYSSYDDRDGVKRYKTEIIANDVELAGGKRREGKDDREERQSSSRNGSKNENRSPKRQQQEERRDDTPNFDDGAGDDDIPF